METPKYTLKERLAIIRAANGARRTLKVWSMELYGDEKHRRQVKKLLARAARRRRRGRKAGKSGTAPKPGAPTAALPPAADESAQAILLIVLWPKSELPGASKR